MGSLTFLRSSACRLWWMHGSLWHPGIRISEVRCFTKYPFLLIINHPSAWCSWKLIWRLLQENKPICLLYDRWFCSCTDLVLPMYLHRWRKQILERFVWLCLHQQETSSAWKDVFRQRCAGLDPKKQYLYCSTNKRASSTSFLLYTSTHAVPPSALGFLLP